MATYINTINDLQTYISSICSSYECEGNFNDYVTECTERAKDFLDEKEFEYGMDITEFGELPDYIFID